jgi:hypothetical protein
MAFSAKNRVARRLPEPVEQGRQTGGAHLIHIGSASAPRKVGFQKT